MKSVWLVEEGEYSDYHIVAAFSSRALADEFVGFYTGEAGVREMSLDEPDPLERWRAGYKLYIVRMTPEGVVIGVGQDTSYTKEEWREVGSIASEAGALWRWGDGVHGPHCWVTVWAKSEEHAVQRVNDRRRQDIALGRLVMT